MKRAAYIFLIGMLGVSLTGCITVRKVVKERVDRKLACECQILYDEREIRKKDLMRVFGVDFESGDVGLAD